MTVSMTDSQSANSTDTVKESAPVGLGLHRTRCPQEDPLPPRTLPGRDRGRRWPSF
jgi:hypothetical protein